MKVLGADTGDQVTCAAHTALPPQGQYCDQAQGQGSDTGIVHGHHAHAHSHANLMLMVNQSSILSHTLLYCIYNA